MFSFTGNILLNKTYNKLCFLACIFEQKALQSYRLQFYLIFRITMDNLEATQNTEAKQETKNSGPVIIAVAAVLIITLALWQFFSEKEAEIQPIAPPITEAAVEVIQPPVIQEEISEPTIELPPIEPPQEVISFEESAADEAEEIELVTPLPNIDESDDYIKGQLPELTWRNELLSLLITEDMIRRFVVFTDNFAQGLIAYDHSIFIQPKNRFSVDESLQNVQGKPNVWRWDNKTSQRFDLYVDLLRSIDSTALVNLYRDIKPLIDEAYGELGYEDDFTITLQDAINRVLDMDLPQSNMNLTRSSVMYKFQDPTLEALPDSDKLLIRLGKENLLIIKSVLLEFNEKLNQQVIINE